MQRNSFANNRFFRPSCAVVVVVVVGAVVDALGEMADGTLLLLEASVDTVGGVDVSMFETAVTVSLDGV